MISPRRKLTCFRQTSRRRRTGIAGSCFLPSVSLAEFKAGAAIVDVTPVQLPVFVNGNMRSKSTDIISTRVNARAIVLDDGQERVAIVVVDSCMMPRPASRRSQAPGFAAELR